MPRGGLHGTTLFPKNYKVDSPFLDQFCELLTKDDQVIPTKALHTEYLAFIETLDLDVILQNLAVAQRRFAKCFASKARDNGWQYNSHGSRGYFVKITRPGRKKVPFKRGSFIKHLTEYLHTPCSSRKVYICRVFISKTKRFGAIALKTIN
jgi:hypothetical protein